MPKTKGWHQKLTAWAGWLLAAVVLVMLAVGALSLSPDGARLRRLAGLGSERAKSREAKSVRGPDRHVAAAHGGVGTRANAGARARSSRGRGMSTEPRTTPVGPERPLPALSHQGGDSAEAQGMRPKGFLEGSFGHAEQGLGKADNSPEGQLMAIPALEGPGKTGAGSKAEPLQQAQPKVHARSQPPSSTTGWIQAEVMGEYQDAQVLLDGEWQGLTPVLLNGIEAGVHRLTFLYGEQLWEEEVRVSAGDTTLAVCSLLKEMAPGQVIVRSPRGPRGDEAGADSVLVDGSYRGQGEAEVDLPPGYHTVTFTRPGASRRHVVIHVPPGSVQYVSPPGASASLAMRHKPPERDGKGLLFTLQIDPVPKSTPEVALCFAVDGTPSLRIAQMSWQPSHGVFMVTIDAKSLPAAYRAQYFFRATLSSGEEIDSQMYSLQPPR